MKTTLLIVIISLATVLARPPAFESEEEYTDNNLIDSIPPEHQDERTEYVQM